MPSLSSKDRAALVTESAKAMSKYLHIDLKDRDGDRIPTKLWSPTMTSLKPLRVVNDRVNLKIVLVESEHFESGFYVRIAISSFAPTASRFAEFVQLSKPGDGPLGTLYRYRLAKAKVKE